MDRIDFEHEKRQTVYKTFYNSIRYAYIFDNFAESPSAMVPWFHPHRHSPDFHLVFLTSLHFVIISPAYVAREIHSKIQTIVTIFLNFIFFSSVCFFSASLSPRCSNSLALTKRSK